MSKDVELPAWACVTDKRHAHITRVTALIDEWAEEEGARPLAVRVGDQPVPLRAQR